MSTGVEPAGSSTPIDAAGGREWWKLVIVAVAVFPLISLWNIPESIRPIYLTAGACSVGTFALFGFVVHSYKNMPVFILGSFIIMYWTFAFPAVVNGMDDNSAYLIFARDFYSSLERSLQPLSERRLFSVGGLYAFQEPVLRWLGTEGLTLVEPVLGLTLFISIAAARADEGFLPGSVLLIGLAGLAPLGGSSIIANSSSVFTLAAFSFALLEVIKAILESQKIKSLDVFLLVSIPVVAALFRPTTAPFHILVALSCICAVFGSIYRKILLTCIIIFPAVFLALLPYEAVFGTYLYPLLGSGYHISAGGIDIYNSLNFHSHIANIFKLMLMNPIFIGSTILAAIAWCGNNKAMRQFIAISYSSFSIFYIVIIAATAGVASTRYIFPVFMAMSASLILMIKPVILRRWTKEKNIQGNRFVHFLIFITIVTMTTAVFIKRDIVSKNRYRYHYISEEKIEYVSKIRKVIGASSGNTLIIYTGDERFILETIKSGYFIMDLPGMIFPSEEKNISYEEALRNFIYKNEISTLIFPYDNDDFTRKNYQNTPWHRILADAAEVNSRAVRKIAEHHQMKRVGDAVVVSIDAEQIRRP